MTTNTTDLTHFDPRREVAIRWHIEDVLQIRPDLSEAQAWQVLQWAEKTHDAGIGINWHTLESDTVALFGPEPKEGDAA
jgi:hypothetical protein